MIRNVLIAAPNKAAVISSTASATLYRSRISSNFISTISRHYYHGGLRSISSSSLGTATTTTTTTTKKRYYSNTTKLYEKEKSSEDATTKTELFYEGPFSVMIMRLKAVSTSGAVISLIGMPTLMHLYSDKIPQAAQFAVGSTTMAFSCLSTLAVHICFTPYVHKMEYIKEIHNDDDEDEEDEIDNDNDEEREVEDIATITDEGKKTPSSTDTKKKQLLKIEWRNMFVQKKEIVFDPAKDTVPYVDGEGWLPACNFYVYDIPLYIHPELIMDDTLRANLIGKEKAAKYNLPSPENFRNSDEEELTANVEERKKQEEEIK